MKIKKPIIIPGPCAAESKEQIDIAIAEAKKRNVDFLRVNLWKPRTKPGFEGLEEAGIPFMVEAAKQGVNPGTEVLTPHQAKIVMNTVLAAAPTAKVLLWLGARNQNHFIQQEIASIVARDRRAFLLVKNQPWVSEEHWEGIVDHVLAGGISQENLIVCHRGFVPTGDNPLHLRNMPDFEMAMRVKTKTNLPMVFDPSHTGGSVENVFALAKEAGRFALDGVMIEVHHDPKNAITDSKQQVTWEEFDEIVKLMNLSK